jgi:hypothetical protein
MLKMNAVTIPSNPDEGKNGTGQWKKGASGNPAGRPRGSRNKATLLMEQLIEDQGPELIQKLIDLAKNGDIRAMQLCVDRLIPRHKDRPIDFEMQPLLGYADFDVAFNKIFQAIASGQITPSEGEKLARIIQYMFEIEVMNFEERVQRLEQYFFPTKQEAPILEKERQERMASFLNGTTSDKGKPAAAEEKATQGPGATHESA